jgi:integrase/recombinase XerD
MNNYIEEFSNYLTTQKESSDNTKESYIRDVSFFFDYLKDHNYSSPVNIPDSQVQSYVHHLQEMGRNPTSISRSVSSIRCFYKFMIFNNYMDKNPARNVKLEKAVKKLPQVLTGEEIDLLLAQPPLNEAKGCRDKAMLELLYATGIRVSELINLNLADINLRNATLTINNTKGSRQIPVYTSAIVAVSDYIFRMRSIIITKESGDALFVNLNGNRLTRQGFWKIVKGYAAQAGITKELTPHTLRHSFALHLLENGASVKDIQTMMGHADISSTQVYIQLLDNHMKAVYNSYHPRAHLRNR